MPISWSAVLPGLTLLSVLTTLSPVYAQNSTAATAAGAATGITTQAGTAMPDSSAYQATSTSASGSSASASASAVMVPSTAPTGKIEGDYTGALRPQVHFSPPVGFMNDPNGLFVDKNGTWHLYYQYNPTDLVAGNQHWGHATSTDLYRWDNQPIALFPPNNQSGIFSGSAVIDKNNTSGFFPDQDDGVIAIYTLNAPDSQTQEIAYSRDGGYSFEKYEGNPVIDVGSANFRDPKVIWYEDHWVMVVAYATEFVISIYTSPDLKDWTHSSNVTDIGLIGLLYECPNLVQVPVWENGTATDELAWILLISINPGAPLGGSISQYFPGTFDGYKFTPYDGIARISDFAKDNYAEQYFYGTPADQPISIAWASNWQYTNVLPTASEGWRSIMSLPRYNYLTKVERTGWEMGSLPYNIDSIKSNQFSFDSDFVNESVTVDYSNVTSGAIYFEANFTFPENVAIPANASFRLNFTSPAGDSMKAGYYFGGPNPGVAWIDRRGTKAYGDEDPLWVDRFSAAAVALTKTVSGVIDRSVFEMFVDQGAFSGTSLFFAEQPMDTMIVETQGMPEGATVKMAVWELSSGWQ